MNWHHFPMLRLLLPFLTGIMLAIFGNLHFNIPLPLIFSGFVFCIVWLILTKTKPILKRYNLIFTYGIYVLLLLTGYRLTLLQDARNRDNFFGKQIQNEKPTFFLCRIIEQPEEKVKSIKILAEVKQIEGKIRQNVSGKIVLYLQKDSLSKQLNYGDYIAVRSQITPVRSPINPHEFDYRQYLAYQQIYYQSYCSSHNWSRFSSGHGNPLYTWAYAARSYLLSIFQKYELTGDEYAVISALLLGVCDYLDPDLQKAFSSAGVTHILSVSGLHVGVVVMFISFLLGFLDRTPKGSIFKHIITLILIWCFAMISGFSPAVLRAAVMFSLLTIGKMYNKQASGYNILAASAFFLLAVDPYLLANVGFQLSYLALAGIMLLHPVIYKCWTPKSKFIDKYIWSLTSVSIAAQIATLPLTLMYFHQFPNYFIIANLLVIPLSNILIWAGIAVWLTAFLPVVPDVIAWGLSYLIKFFNGIVKTIEAAPYSITGNIVVLPWQMVLLFILIGFLTYYFLDNKKKMFMLSLALCCIFAISTLWQNIEHQSQKVITFYGVKGMSGIDFFDGKNNYFLCDSLLQADKNKQGFHLSCNRIYGNISQNVDIVIADTSEYKSPHFYKKANLIQFHNFKIAVIDKLHARQKHAQKIAIQCLLITQNVNVTIADLQKSYLFDKVVIDESSGKWKTQKWEQECMQLKIPCHIIAQKGAMVLQ